MKFIGMFDSGLGGLTILKEAKGLLPKQNFAYLGDMANMPYGSREKEKTIRYSFKNIATLKKHAVIEAVIIACNTAATASLPRATKITNIPIMETMDSNIRSALKLKNIESIAIMATATTTTSDRYRAKLRKAGFNGHIYQKSCPLLAQAIEKNTAKATVKHIKYYTKNMPKKIDCVILGCTHFPIILQKLLRETGLRQKATREEQKKQLSKKVNPKPRVKYVFTGSHGAPCGALSGCSGSSNSEFLSNFN